MSVASAVASSDDAVVVLDRVTKSFGSFVAVHEADFSIRRGEFFSMLGPSGCGKTTTLRMIAGFEQPSAGRVVLDGRDVSSMPPYRRNVNTVFQQYALFPHMNVFDNVAFGPRSRRDTADLRSRVMDMLEVVRLAEFAERRPAQLSGGQQQRVALARALVNLPLALLLDEPLGALDLKLRQAMQIELKRIQREVGITFVFVTHDQEEALSMSDRIAVMSQGRVEQIGTPEEIYSSPASVFVAGFIGTANLVPANVSDANGDQIACQCPDGTVVTTPTSGRAFTAGDAVTVMLRPERLTLQANEPTTTERFRVKITDIIFHGSSSRVIVQTPDHTELLVHVGPDDDLSLVRPGAELWLTWAPGTAYTLAEQSEIVGATTTDVDEVEAAL